jgi:opacity protein-like surface antigen
VHPVQWARLLMGRKTGVLGFWLALLASQALAQEPQGPPPPSGNRVNTGAGDHDLLPDIGRIGAQVAVFGAVSWNPYEVGRGAEIGSLLDLPLRRTSGGRLAYELFVGVSFATSGAFNLSSASFPAPVRTRLRLVQLSPFGFKYKLQSSDSTPLRPYLNAGVDVVFSSTDILPAASFQDPALAERGLPGSQGNIAVGGHGAAGLEIRIESGLLLSLEYRFTATEGKNSHLQTASASFGIRF